MKKHHLTLIIATLFAAAIGHAAAQTYTDAIVEAPPTTKQRVENMQVRHDKSIADLQSLFDRIAKDAALISSKEAVDAIDQGDRALRNNRAAIASLVTTLKAEAKTITAEASFTEDQKAELLAAVESMNTKCDDLSARTTVAIDHLGGSYKEMAKWRKIYKTYLNLDGETNAKKQLASAVEEYVKGLTAAPEAPEKESTETKPAEAADNKDSQ